MDTSGGEAGGDLAAWAQAWLSAAAIVTSTVVALTVQYWQRRGARRDARIAAMHAAEELVGAGELVVFFFSRHGMIAGMREAQALAVADYLTASSSPAIGSGDALHWLFTLRGIALKLGAKSSRAVPFTAQTAKICCDAAWSAYRELAKSTAMKPITRQHLVGEIKRVNKDFPWSADFQ